MIRRFAACGSGASRITTAWPKARAASPCGCASPRAWGSIVEEVRSCRSVLIGVIFACDAYVQLVRERSLLEAVASSLTEFFAPDIMAKRIVAWEAHYPWVEPEMLAYFRARVTRAKRDSGEALEYVTTHATTLELQTRCVEALIRKTQILWHLLDTTYAAYVEPAWGPRGPRD